MKAVWNNVENCKNISAALAFRKYRHQSSSRWRAKSTSSESRNIANCSGIIGQLGLLISGSWIWRGTPILSLLETTRSPLVQIARPPAAADCEQRHYVAE